MTVKRRTFLNTVGATAAAGVASTAAAEQNGKKRVQRIAALGDLLIVRKVSQIKDPDFLALVDLLRNTDCTWGNGEMLFLDVRKHVPISKGLDPHVSCKPFGAQELAWMGIDFLGLANNHTVDYSDTGMWENMEHLSRAGIAFCGAGADLAQASRPGYFDTAHGRIGQVSFASTFQDHTAAGPSHPYVKGRPGLNPLKLNLKIQVDESLFASMANLQDQVIEGLGYKMFMSMLSEEERTSVNFGQFSVSKGDGFDLIEEPLESDVERILDRVKIARGHADVVLATVHSHESSMNQKTPAKFMQPNARKCIDAGADAYINTGPHKLRGIEMYEGKPIFYSLGNFFFQFQSTRTLPAEAFMALDLDPRSLDTNAFYDRIPYNQIREYWESVVPVMTFEGSKLTRLELHPITMGFQLPRHLQGTPVLARGEDAEKIINDLIELSKPYGTKISYEDGIGVVVI
jgi:poly-gamma-glutamate synthesis protein (capsule biosynthesis protein)